MSPAPVADAVPLRRLNVEISAHCNYACVGCPNTYMTRPKGHMDVELFRAIVDELGELSTAPVELFLWNYGESLLHPGIHAIVDALRGYPGRTVLSTTGWMLDGFDDLRFLAPISEIILSLNGTTQDVYEQHQVGGEVERVLRGARRLAAAVGATTALTLQMVVNRANAGQIEETRALVETIGFHKLRLKSFSVMDRSRATYERFVPGDAGLSRYSEFGVLKPALRRMQPAPCQDWMIVNWDGTVNPCCWDYEGTLVLGNVRTEGVLGVWRGMTLAAHRQRIASGDYYDICDRCVGCTTLPQDAGAGA
jgi:MoaA/NifB/PqqE/SkfB family radical SAM enzyme